jgi:hypothetical protein
VGGKNVNAKNKTKTIPAFFLVKHHKTYAEVVEQIKNNEAVFKKQNRVVGKKTFQYSST